MWSRNGQQSFNIVQQHPASIILLQSELQCYQQIGPALGKHLMAFGGKEGKHYVDQDWAATKETFCDKIPAKRDITDGANWLEP